MQMSLLRLAGPRDCSVSSYLPELQLGLGSLLLEFLQLHGQSHVALHLGLWGFIGVVGLYWGCIWVLGLHCGFIGVLGLNWGFTGVAGIYWGFIRVLGLSWGFIGVVGLYRGAVWD